MPKYIHLQVRGVEKPVRVEADFVEKSGRIGTSDFALLLKLKDKQVGKFRGGSVEGWWIAEESN